jgi:hypothetical protein
MKVIWIFLDLRCSIFVIGNAIKLQKVMEGKISWVISSQFTFGPIA